MGRSRGSSDATGRLRRTGIARWQLSLYTKTDDGRDGLWRMPVSGGEETRIIHDVIATRAFFVTADSIYFIKAVAGNGPLFVSRTLPDTIEIHSLRTGQTRTLARIANPWL